MHKAIDQQTVVARAAMQMTYHVLESADLLRKGIPAPTPETGSGRKRFYFTGIVKLHLDKS